MLDPETRRRIDACRDVLVGKIPDPKAQVEQITTALIYKFMDDMDAESESLGGKPSFFTGKYKNYAWDKLLSKQLSGQDRMDLYIRATSAFGTAEHLPKLFRDIFIDSFLPYRDPETLNLFLKEVDGFKYEHSEDLGDAYEYLLRILGSQGDAGQFRTPRHIIEFIVDCVDPQVNESILDPACGTAGFLISAYRHIIEKHNPVETRHGASLPRNKPLTKSERERLIKNIEGYDISPDMVRISRVNMYLHGFPVPKIVEYDSLTSEERWEDNFDVILANPPFMSPKGGIRPHSKFMIEANRSEVLFSDYIMEHLKPGGRAGFIVPEGIIFQSGNAYKELRKRLIEDYGLFAVVSLPAGVFQPYSGVKTSILLIDKNFAKGNDNILFVKINNDGFEIGAQRRPSPDKDDLPKTLEIIRSYKTSVETRHGASLPQNVLIIPKSKIAASGDYNLSMDRYRDAVATGKQKWPMVKLGDVGEYINGFPFKPTDWGTEGKPIIRIQNLTGTNEEYNYTTRKDVPEKYHVVEGDLLISWSATIGFYYWKGPDALLNQHIFKVVPSDQIKKEFLFFLGEIIIEKIKGKVHGNTMQHITKGLFDAIEIPLPPLSVQEELVAELERYRKMTEGARAIISNYKPEIEINPEWEMRELGESGIEIIDGDRGANYPSKEEFSSKGYCLFLSTKNVRDNGFLFDEVVFITKEKDAKLRKGKLKRNDVVLTTRGTIGNIALYDDTIPYDNIRINSGMVLLRADSNSILPSYLYQLFQTPLIKDQEDSIVSGSAQPQLPIRAMVRIKIPYPPLPIQEEIVTRLESERAEMEMLKGLILRMEGKIKEKVAGMWG